MANKPFIPKVGGVPIAQVHSHFTIFRDIHEPNMGEVTLAEQIKAVHRFVRWHERQVQVGKKLLAQLIAQVETPHAAADEGRPEATVGGDGRAMSPVPTVD